MSARNGVRVRVYDNSNNLINIYPTITSAAIHYNVDHNTVSKCIKNGNLICNHRFVGEIKDVRVLILDKNYDTVNLFSTAQKTAEFCRTSHTALARYLKSGKL